MIVGVLGLLWPGVGCGPKATDVARLRQEVTRLRTRLANERAAQRKDTAALRRRVARLEASLDVVRRARVVLGPTPKLVRPPVRPDPEGPDPVLPAANLPAPRSSCPAALPDGARRIRRRMKVAKARGLLRGVRTQESQAIKLTGSGTRTERVWSGPCFRITLAGGRVTGVQLEGVAPRRRRTRRRR
ncbi:MAG: hypothetical protein ABI333_28045 [bacterium]